MSVWGCKLATFMSTSPTETQTCDRTSRMESASGFCILFTFVLRVAGCVLRPPLAVFVHVS